MISFSIIIIFQIIETVVKHHNIAIPHKIVHLGVNLSKDTSQIQN